jgi:hypothetical protein
MTNSKLQYLAALIVIAPQGGMVTALICSGILLVGAYFSKD